jgi:hypothetical protein
MKLSIDDINIPASFFDKIDRECYRNTRFIASFKKDTPIIEIYTDTSRGDHLVKIYTLDKILQEYLWQHEVSPLHIEYEDISKAIRLKKILERGLKRVNKIISNCEKEKP